MSLKSRDITDFFKPFAQSRNKRPRSVDDAEDTITVSSSRASKLPNNASPASLSKDVSVSSPKSGNIPRPGETTSITIRSPSKSTKAPTIQPFTSSFGNLDGSGDKSNWNHEASTDTAVEAPISGEASTQRVVKNGQVIIRSSDDEDSASSASLDDLADLLGRREPSPSSSPLPEQSPPKIEPKEERNLRSRSKGARISMTKAGSTALPSVTSYKFSLDSLVTDTVDDNEVEAGVAKARSTFNALQEGNGEASSGSNSNKELNEDVLASVVDQEEEGAGFKRLLNAVRRTEALNQEKTWSFFSRRTSLQGRSPCEDFPCHAIKSTGWESVLKEPMSRQRAFLSGFVAENMVENSLPDEVILWIFDAVTFERRDDLRYTYVSAVRGASAGRIPPTLTSTDFHSIFIDRAFRRLGAKPDALDPRSPIEPQTHYSSSDAEVDRGCLLSFIDLLGGLAPKISRAAQGQILVLLLRLALDVPLMSDCRVSLATERAVISFLESMLNAVANDLFDTIADTTLQSQLIKHIPPCSTDASLFRCRLALAFLLREWTPLEESVEELYNLRRLKQALDKPDFDTSRSQARNSTQDFDFANLSALTFLLDVAIDDGHPPNPCTKDAEKAFNASVDALADRIKSIFSAIEDSGASHMKRTEAKESLEALHYRLIYGVRTKPRPKKPLFGDKEMDEWMGLFKSGALMERFLKVNKEEQEEELAEVRDKSEMSD